MREMASNRMKVWSVVIFLLGLLSAAFAFGLQTARESKSFPAYTIISKRTFTPSDGGQPMGELTMTRYQRTDGTWKQIVTYFKSDGTVNRRTVTFGQPGRGVFQQDEDQANLKFISQMDKPLSELPLFDIRSDPAFLKELSILGYQTFVLRSYEEDSSGDYSDVYYAPAFHNLSLKEVSYSKRGVTVLEPVEIRIGEPRQDDFGSLPNGNVDYELFEQKIRVLDDRGKLDAANAIKQELQRRLRDNP